MGTTKQRFLKLAAVFLGLYNIYLFMIASGRLVISSIVDFKGGMKGIALIIPYHLPYSIHLKKRLFSPTADLPTPSSLLSTALSPLNK